MLGIVLNAGNNSTATNTQVTHADLFISTGKITPFQVCHEEVIGHAVSSLQRKAEAEFTQLF